MTRIADIPASQTGSSRASSRLSGWALFAGSIGVILGFLMIPVIPGPLGVAGPGSIQSNVPIVVGGLLVLGSLPALYSIQAQHMKAIGKIGVGMIWLGTVLAGVILSVIQILADISITSSAPQPGPVGPPLAVVILAGAEVTLAAIGGVIVGIKTARGRILPQGVGWLLLVGSAIAAISFPIPYPVLSASAQIAFVVVYFGGIAWAGARIGLSSDKGAPDLR